MKNLFAVFILLISHFSLAQSSIIGVYKDHFGHEIVFKADSTFRFSTGKEVSSSWSVGKWSIDKNTVHLETTLILDTLQYRDEDQQIVKDTLVLSSDEIISRIEDVDHFVDYISSSGQNRVEPPKNMYYKKNKLFEIRLNGEIEKKRLKVYWTKQEDN